MKIGELDYDVSEADIAWLREYHQDNIYSEVSFEYNEANLKALSEIFTEEYRRITNGKFSQVVEEEYKRNKINVTNS